MSQSLKADVDEHKKPVSKAVVEAQKAVDNVKQSRDPPALQLAQKLRCNTSDLQIGYERVRRLSSLPLCDLNGLD
jgi:hypothetical protein